MHLRYETNTRLLTFFAQSKSNLCWNVHDLSDWRRMFASGAGLLLKYPPDTLINQVQATFAPFGTLISFLNIGVFYICVNYLFPTSGFLAFYIKVVQ